MSVSQPALYHAQRRGPPGLRHGLPVLRADGPVGGCTGVERRLLREGDDELPAAEQLIVRHAQRLQRVLHE
jgi:hypothetical protein